MAKKLKTYETSLGFFDLAIAAPSMKAALEAWGADSNLFHQGAAKQSEDPNVVAATMAKPGVMLKRPVGSNGPFKEHAELPTNLGDATARPSKAARKPAGRKPKETSSRPADKAAEQKATVAYEREQKRRDRGRGKRPPGRKSANSGSRPSIKRKRLWTMPSASMRRKQRQSRLRWKLSRKNRKPRMPGGIRKGGGWRPRCDARETRAGRTDRHVGDDDFRDHCDR
jgi:hypothetical protein